MPTYEIKINKPETQKIYACIGEVQVTPYDSTGNAWDNGMFNETEERPDITVALYTTEIRTKLPTIKNKYFTKFDKCLQEIIISKGDTPKLILIDDDEQGFQIIDKLTITENLLQELSFPYEKIKNTTIWQITKVAMF